MNIIFKIIIICVFTAIISIVLKNFSSPFIPVLSLCCGLVCIYFLIPYIRNIIDYILKFKQSTSSADSIIRLTIKIAAISVICEFGGQLCCDSGAEYLASKILFAGKIVIMCITLPHFIDLFEKIISHIWVL